MLIAMAEVVFKVIAMVFQGIKGFVESKPAELPRQLLAERYVSLSTHTAPIRQTHLAYRIANVQTILGFLPISFP